MSNEFIEISTELPPYNKVVLVYITKPPEKWNQEYSGLIDKSDRTAEALIERKHAVKYIKENPIQFAYLYKSATGNHCWMVLSNSDSKQGFISSNGEVSHWSNKPKLPNK
jgi:hypothetical protein